MSKLLIPKFEKFRSVGKQIPKWTDPNGIYFRLPEHYKQRQREFLNTIPQPVHYKTPESEYKVDHEHGVKVKTQSVPIQVLYPTQSKLGLWGGEGIIAGMKKPKQKGFKRPEYLSTKLWRPKILKMVFYTEILDKYYALTCTRRTLELIEEAKGFDNYILKTPEVDLKSEIGMQLKREMLITLAKKETDLYPNDKSKKDTIYKRYKSFVLPLEEAEWIGLKPWEAMVKQKKIDEENMKKSIRPLKEVFTQETIDRLNSGEKIELTPTPTTDNQSIFSKLYTSAFKK